MKTILWWKRLSFLVVYSLIMLIQIGCSKQKHVKNYKINFNIVKTYCSENPETPYFFAGILDACINNDRIYIMDWKTSDIKIFDRNLKYISKFGKKGEGPGEFKQIFVDIACTDKYVYVITLSRVHIFNKNGVFIKRINLDFLPREMYLIKNGYLFLNLSSHIAFNIVDKNFHIVDKFYKKQRLLSTKCKNPYVMPNAYLTKSGKLLVFSPFEYKICGFNIKTKKEVISIVRKVPFNNVKCKRRKLAGYKIFDLADGFSYMLEDTKYYYYFYYDKKDKGFLDVYNKKFEFQWSGHYEGIAILLIAGFKGNSFIGLSDDSWDSLKVFKIAKVREE